MRLPKILTNVLLLLAALLLVLAINLIWAPTVDGLDARLGDKIWQWVSRDAAQERRVVVIDIDEASIARYGAWPWSRLQMAGLSEKIAEQGAALQIFDVVFADQKPGDEVFAQQFINGNIVLAEILAINVENDTQIGELVSGIYSEKCKGEFLQARAYIGISPVLAKVASAAGHITPVVDGDGVVRSMPAYVCRGRKAYPALSLSALTLGSGLSGAFEIEQGESMWGALRYLKHPGLPEIQIPLDKENTLLLPWWLSKESMVSISAADVIEGRLEKGILDGAWVLVGSTAFGSGDSISTPLTGLSDGLVVHVQMLSASLDNKIPYRMKGENSLKAAIILVVGFLMWTVMGARGAMRIFAPPLMSVVLIGCVVYLQTVLLQHQNIRLPTALILMFTMLAGCSVALKGYFESWMENKRLYNNLASYLPEHAAKWIARQDPVHALSAKHEQVFVMYVDLRNFSRWCNRLPADQVGVILHSFYKSVTQTIQMHDGFVEKYVDGSVLAIWRDLTPSIVLAANELSRMSENLFGDLEDNPELPPLAVGIGIEFGQILVGSFGPAHRKEYTVIGKAATSAMQLQEMTAELAFPVLVGEQAAGKLRDQQIEMESLGRFLLLGAQQPMEIFATTES